MNHQATTSLTFTRPAGPEGGGFRLPALPADRFPVKFHPDTEHLARASKAWMRSYTSRFLAGEGSSAAAFLGGQIALFVCLAMPNTNSVHAQAACDLTHYAFLLDDHVSDRQSLGASPRAARHVAGSIMAVLAGWEPPSAATAGIADIRRRLLPVMTPDAWERFCIKFEAMLEGYEIEVSRRNGNWIASYDEYMLLRRMTVGIEWFMVIAEQGLATPPDEGALENAELRRACHAALDHIGLVNDVFSFPKEHADRESYNAITVVQNAEGLDTQQAFAYVNEQIDALAQEYLRMRETVLRGPLSRVPGIRSYLDEWGYAMAGNLRWSLITPRYNGSAHAWDGTAEGLGALCPERQSPQPKTGAASTVES